jgi:putative transcriptional regulator
MNLRNKGRIVNSIKEMRVAAGFTQEDLAHKVGATRQTIIAVEAMKYAPSLELACRIALALKQPFDAVFQFKPDNSPDPWPF